MRAMEQGQFAKEVRLTIPAYEGLDNGPGRSERQWTPRPDSRVPGAPRGRAGHRSGREEPPGHPFVAVPSVAVTSDE